MRTVNETDIIKFEEYLYEEEMSKNTIEKYIRDVKKFQTFANGEEITKKLTMRYKEYLLEHYKTHSVNSFIVSLNRFLEFKECFKEKLKTEKIQTSVYIAEEKDLTKAEYEKLVEAAFQKKNERLAMLMQTIGSTGIRVSELKYITVEAVKKGSTNIRNKGKNRDILIGKDIRKLLLKYVQKRGIKKGSIFVTKNGNPIDRSNICKDMKKLCRKAGVDERKVFPHNLRHLFAKMFYKIDKDITKLADILGHSSIDTTRIYLKTTSREHQKMLEEMKLVFVKKTEEYLKEWKKHEKTPHIY